MEIMSFILQYWWVWITTAVASFVFVVYNQLKRVGRLSEARDVKTAKKGIFKGLGSMIFFCLVFLISALLVIVNIIVMILRAV